MGVKWDGVGRMGNGCEKGNETGWKVGWSGVGRWDGAELEGEMRVG